MDENPKDRERILITDDYMFSYVMRQEGICAAVIECLLPGIHVGKVQFKDVPEDAPAEIQKTIQGGIASRGVRLDVYLDDGKTIFNVEMQTGNKRDLAKRSRYYGGLIDCDQLRKSQNYSELRPTYVIFLCTFDMFGLDRYCYSFRYRCDGNNDLQLEDGSYKLFFNAKGHQGNISEELKQLLAYFMNMEMTGEVNELVKRIDGIVEYANHDEEWRRGYMTFTQAKMDAKNEGIALGKLNAYTDSVRNMRSHKLPDELIAQYLGLPLQFVRSVTDK